MPLHLESARRFVAALAKSLRRRCAPQRRRLFLEPLEGRQLLAAFMPGNIVAYRVGTIPNPVALDQKATAVFLDEFDPSGALVQSIPLPTTTVGGASAG